MSWADLGTVLVKAVRVDRRQRRRHPPGALRAYLDPDCPDARQREVSSTRSWAISERSSWKRRGFDASGGGIRRTREGAPRLCGVIVGLHGRSMGRRRAHPTPDHLGGVSSPSSSSNSGGPPRTGRFCNVVVFSSTCSGALRRDPLTRAPHAAEGRHRVSMAFPASFSKPPPTAPDAASTPDQGEHVPFHPWCYPDAAKRTAEGRFAEKERQEHLGSEVRPT
jgi:hypothetical protein